ncbi:hypothetical protein Droror1_Dr00008160 [Drosera rotundifolia]
MEKHHIQSVKHSKRLHYKSQRKYRQSNQLSPEKRAPIRKIQTNQSPSSHQSITQNHHHPCCSATFPLHLQPPHNNRVQHQAPSLQIHHIAAAVAVAPLQSVIKNTNPIDSPYLCNQNNPTTTPSTIIHWIRHQRRHKPRNKTQTPFSPRCLHLLQSPTSSFPTSSPFPSLTPTPSPEPESAPPSPDSSESSPLSAASTCGGGLRGDWLEKDVKKRRVNCGWGRKTEARWCAAVRAEMRCEAMCRGVCSQTIKGLLFQNCFDFL